MKTPLGKNILTPWLAAVALTSLSALTAWATPYATELSNNIGTVYFTINESADNVKIIYGTTTNVIGPLAAGSYSTNVGATTPYSVEVTKNGGIGYKTATAPGVAGKIQISTDPLLSRFPTPRGVGVNKNPASAYFGRIYVANSTTGTTATRPVGRGLYTLKSDFTDSPNNYGNTAQTAGLPFVVSANSPYRLSVGADDFVYIADFSDAGSSVTRMNGDLQIGERVLDFVGGPSTISAPTNHGSTVKVISRGSLGAGDLKIYTLDEDYNAYGTTNKYTLWRYDIGSGPLTNTSLPTALGSYLVVGALEQDFDIGPNGYFYLSQRRDIGGGATPALIILDATGAKITDSVTVWRDTSGNPSADEVLTNVNSVAVSPDGKYLALNLRAAGNSDTLIIPLTNGIPDLGNRRLLDTGTVTQGRGVDFDAAGNLYTISSGDAVLRAFSPGGPSVATTSSGGTFSLVVPETVVSISTTAPAAEPATSGTLTLSRSGDLGVALTVAYSIGGTATNGTDYQAISQSITFGVGETSTNITITPIDEFIAEPTETVTITLSNNASYSLGTAVATLPIVDDETPAIDISTVRNSVYERNSFDFARLRLTRLGSTNDPVTVGLNYGGAATSGVDFNGPATVNIDAGVINANFDVTPVDDPDTEGNELIIATVATGSGYVPGTNNVTGSANLVDDDVVDQIILFADDFGTLDYATNWTVLFAATNVPAQDFFYEYGFNYGGLGIPSAPHSTGGDTTGIRMYVNKSAISAAALNLYMTNQAFSGDYALRFDMYLIQGTAATTEYALFGINHSATKTNWFRNSTSGFAGVSSEPGWTFDGLFYGVEADGAALGDYAIYSSPTTAGNNPTALTAGRNASTLTDIFKAPPWSAAGAPANLLTSATPSWADVEVSQVGNLVSLKINNTLIFTYTNDTAYTAGQIMLGYCDAYDSTSSASAQVFFDNVRVVKAALLNITNIEIVGGDVKITFTWPVAEPNSAFELLSSGTVNGTYAPETGASFEVVTPGVSYRASVPLNGSARYYRVHRL